MRLRGPSALATTPFKAPSRCLLSTAGLAYGSRYAGASPTVDSQKIRTTSGSRIATRCARVLLPRQPRLHDHLACPPAPLLAPAVPVFDAPHPQHALLSACHPTCLLLVRPAQLFRHLIPSVVPSYQVGELFDSVEVYATPNWEDLSLQPLTGCETYDEQGNLLIFPPPPSPPPSPPPPCVDKLRRCARKIPTGKWTCAARGDDCQFSCGLCYTATQPHSHTTAQQHTALQVFQTNGMPPRNRMVRTTLMTRTTTLMTRTTRTAGSPRVMEASRECCSPRPTFHVSQAGAGCCARTALMTALTGAQGATTHPHYILTRQCARRLWRRCRGGLSRRTGASQRTLSHSRSHPQSPLTVGHAW